MSIWETYEKFGRLNEVESKPNCFLQIAEFFASNSTLSQEWVNSGLWGDLVRLEVDNTKPWDSRRSSVKYILNIEENSGTRTKMNNFVSW